MTQKETTFRIAGIGGQGIVLAGYILGNAATIYEKKYALFTRQYGPEARGANCYSSVIVSDQPILYPIICSPSIYICMSKKAFDADNACTVTPETIICTDKNVDISVCSSRRYSVAADLEARHIGSRMVANMVMLGYVTALTGLIRKESMIESIHSAVEQQYLPLNLAAFNRGFSLYTSEL
ncbi:MAG: 2-oxoacid:acceptor oxidoreductase family protein [Candidatus Auribacterota bacterium]|jgi:2-oxoglutarate ferredoxin oxidoreductase subunit gamma|nr:2-oxoacid:acceptor oxidoreductase family protein [Candidatus Auribacterota bacterium]